MLGALTVRRLSHRPMALMAPALLVLLLAPALLHAGQALHLHRGNTAGLYNEEHVLASLESLTGDAPLTAVTSQIALVLLAGASIPAAGEPLVSPVARYTESRAPPLV